MQKVQIKVREMADNKIHEIHIQMKSGVARFSPSLGIVQVTFFCLKTCLGQKPNERVLTPDVTLSIYFSFFSFVFVIVFWLDWISRLDR